MGFQEQVLVIHGRKPVLEALQSSQEVVRVHISSRAAGKIVTEIENLAGAEALHQRIEAGLVTGRAAILIE